MDVIARPAVAAWFLVLGLAITQGAAGDDRIADQGGRAVCCGHQTVHRTDRTAARLFPAGAVRGSFRRSRNELPRAHPKRVFASGPEPRTCPADPVQGGGRDLSQALGHRAGLHGRLGRTRPTLQCPLMSAVPPQGRPRPSPAQRVRPGGNAAAGVDAPERRGPGLRRTAAAACRPRSRVRGQDRDRAPAGISAGAVGDHAAAPAVRGPGSQLGTPGPGDRPVPRASPRP